MGLKGQNVDVAVVEGGVQESGKEDSSFSWTCFILCTLVNILTGHLGGKGYFPRCEDPNRRERLRQEGGWVLVHHQL